MNPTSVTVARAFFSVLILFAVACTGAMTGDGDTDSGVPAGDGSPRVDGGAGGDAGSDASDGGRRRRDGSATSDEDGGPIDGGAPHLDAGTTPGTRDPLRQPFASSSIWNMPIGSGAEYVPANLRSVPGGGSTWALPSSDTDFIVMRPSAPAIDVRYSSVGWGGGNRCTPSSAMVLATVPMPNDFIVMNDTRNDAAAFLAADGRTVIQVQPLARCSAGGVATSLVRAPDVDLYGDGIEGAHGGSGLSSIGGTLRAGELRPGDTGPRHAIKVTVYMKEAYRCTTASTCYRWPAVRGDSYAVGFYGTASGNPNVSNSAFVMGALLALPPDVDIASLGLETEPAEQLAWTLQNYGAYVVDDAYDAAFYIATDGGPDGSFTDQFRDDWGYSFEQASSSTTAWVRDMKRILPELAIVDNNGPSSVGGGGTPRQPLAPDLE